MSRERARRRRPRNGPAQPPQPGNGLMTLEEANAQIARRNREANEHHTRIRDIRKKTNIIVRVQYSCVVRTRGLA